MFTAQSTLRWLLLAALGAIPASSSAHNPEVSAGPPWQRHPHDRPEERFDLAEAASCLSEAKTVLRENAFILEVMTAAIASPTRSPRACAEPGLFAFDGWWRGRWNAMTVEHLWLTVRPGVQLVVISDDGVISHGINFERGGELCGIVAPPEGPERLHQGRSYPSTPSGPAYIKWLTPDRNYYERVTCSEDGPTYQIVETVVTETESHPSTVAQYHSPDVF